MVAPAEDPAGKPYGLADMFLAEIPAGVGAIEMHYEPVIEPGWTCYELE
jgi:hypothetical protein